MEERFTFGKLKLSVSGARPPAQPADDTPFRFLLLGDFSGRKNRGVAEPVSGRTGRRVDLDTVEAVLARIAPRLDLELARGERIEMQFTKLDDFRPDHLWAEHAFFAPHREMRNRLTNPTSFKAAMAEIAPNEATEPPPQGAGETTGETLDRLLGRPAAPSASPVTPASVVEALIKQIVVPRIESHPDPRQAEVVAAFDAAVSGQMRAVLHHPDFQALEAAWRGVDFLLRNVDLDETLELHLLDVAHDELAADLRASEDLATSATCEMLVEQTAGTPGGRRWALIAGLFEFQPTDDHADFLARMAKIAAATGASFIAGAGSQFLEATEARAEMPAFGKAWQKLRQLPEARHLGLIAPRFLLRLPYGRGTDEIDGFAFEEMPVVPRHDALLWGNPALISTLLVAASYRDTGWGSSPQDGSEVSGLPMHIFKESGEKKMTPCGEILLTDRVAENLLALGVMPLASIRDRDAVRLVRFQSLAQPAARLANF